MISIIFAIALQQGKESGPLLLPVGSAKWFQETVVLIESAVEEKNWLEATRLAKRLPTNDFVITWDTSGVPNSMKTYMETARDETVEEWTKMFTDLKVSFNSRGSLKIGFTESLPIAQGTSEHLSAVFMSSPGEEDPVIEAIFSLKRGATQIVADPSDMRNEFMYAIGLRLGVERMPKPGAFMFRTEGSFPAKNRIAPSDVTFVKKIISLSDRIRMSIAEKKDPGIRAPQISIDPKKMAPKPGTQGGDMTLSIQVTNRGAGTMQYQAVPDCGCFILGPYDNQLEPGETTLIPVRINTLEFVGKLRKTLFIYSNDPDDPVIQIPLETYVKPAYRFINQFKGSVVYMDSSGVVFETVMAIDPNIKFNLKKISALGISAVVDYEPWTGMVSDPDLAEPPTKMSGYLIKVLVAPGLVTGRGGVGIQVDTDHEWFKSIQHSVTIQTGIAAIPSSIYFGNLSDKPARGSVVITRPDRPYKVLKVESDTEFIKVEVEPYEGIGNYRIIAVFNGKARVGRFFAKITVYTDDPKEPLVTIPLEGNVK